MALSRASGTYCLAMRFPRDIVLYRRLLHQRLGHFGQQEIGGFFLAERTVQQQRYIGLTDLPGKTFAGPISGDLVVLHFLRGGDEGEIGSERLLALPFLNRFLAFFNQAHHGLAGLRLGLCAQKFKGLFQPLNVIFRLRQVLLKCFLQSGIVGSPGHLGKSLCELRFRVKQILEFFNQQFFQLRHIGVILF